MKRSLVGISAGVYLFLLSVYYWIFYNDVGLFIILLNAFALTLIISGIFEYRKYYNNNLYLTIIALILVGMLVLSYLQTSLPSYQNSLTLSYILIGIFTAAIIYLAHGLNHKWKNLKK